MSGGIAFPRSASRAAVAVAAALLAVVTPGAAVSAEPPATTPDEFKARVAPFLKGHCTDCHSGAKPKGGFDLTTLAADPGGADADRWRAVLDRLATGDMPPDDKPRPPAADVARVAAWADAGLKAAGKPGARPHVLPADGNRVPHAVLFGSPATPGGASAPRVWRLSPYAYTEFVAALAGKPDPKKPVPQPFAGLTDNGLKDYAAAFTVDEPTTQQLYANAKLIVAKQTAFIKGDAFAKNNADKDFGPLFGTAAPSRAHVEAAVRHQVRKAIRREPTADELKRFADLVEKNRREAGADGVVAALAAILVHPEAVFRHELGAGAADAFGRRMLSPRELAFAVGYALTDKGPDKQLLDAAGGKLSTPAEVEAHVKRLLAAPAADNPRVLRFFREYFGYPLALDVFKDLKDNPDHNPNALVAATDRLVLHVLTGDKDVFRELLTTNVSFVPTDATKGKGGAGKAPRLGAYTSFNLKEPPTQQPVALPKEQRAGVLTQPSWLAAYSTNADNHAILRGKWVRERLLGGTVPDLPITVDAQLPDDPKRTLRDRMTVTKEAYCWNCHQKMNDLGLAFEMFDHFGRYRTSEAVLDVEATKKNVDNKGKPLGPVMTGAPLDASGAIAGSGDPKLDGPVTDAVDLVRKLAASERVEQVFVRHAFRYWMGRNETPADAYTLQQAHKAYKDSGGSMKALVASLLTSEAFLYRWATK